MKIADFRVVTNLKVWIAVILMNEYAEIMNAVFLMDKYGNV